MSFPRQYRRTTTARASAAGDEARSRVLDVALDLFADSGYRGTSIAQVAQCADLSQTGLLHHFPSKAALLEATLEHWQQHDGRLVERDGNAPMGWAAFDALAELVTSKASRPGLARLFATLSAEALDPDHPAHAWLIDHYDSLSEWLTAAVEYGRDHSEIHPDVQVASLVRTTIATIDGLQLQWLASDRSFDMAAEFREYVARQRAVWQPCEASASSLRAEPRNV